MTNLKPVRGQILLTGAEFSSLVGMMRQTSLGTQAESIVRSLFASLNTQRCGAPVGEVRRSPKGTIAVRCQREAQMDGHGAPYWEVPHLQDSTKPTPDQIERWEVIHREYWDKRLTELDYTPVEAAEDA